ncbi:MAG: 2,3-bisphosphoglycerate-independent phosphoglycerate mutase [Planctomycetes bacterium]|nr:2,3-bisphosphoglycerate-independent phosphoglycerate mutase [Planctomycetota bacterium]
MTSTSSGPVVLVIRDGWGANPNPSHDAFNAVHLAKTPVADRLMREYPWTLIKTSGEDVGLPDATMGNSEVGHQNIGAGRVVPQESLVMTKACQSGLHTNVAIRASVERCLLSDMGRVTAVQGSRFTAQPGGHNRALHLLGINSDAGVHGLLEHLYAILQAAKTLGLSQRVYVHLFTDGRDTGPYTGLEYAKQVQAACDRIGVGRIASVAGRYYAMDRDHRWERVQLVYDILTKPSATPNPASDALAAIQQYYDNPSGATLKGDEFVTPQAVGDSEQIASSRMKDGDSVIFFNYRGDRPRELSAAFCFPDDKWAKVKPSPDSGKNGFDRGTKLNLHYTIMTEYWEALLPHVQGIAFPKPPKMERIGGQVVSEAGLKQFRCAETEKYPHVTFFFNDYRDEPFPGEIRENPQSPKVATYDMKPEMSADQVCAATLNAINSPDAPRLIVVNFANADMVGHTGSLPAAIAACETVDACVGQIVEATLAKGGSLIVTADHGNAEQMFDPTSNAPHTSHTVYDVPLIVVGERFKGRTLRGDRETTGWFKPEVRAKRGRLADIFPTLLAMMGMEQPAAMTGSSLLGH